MKFRRGQTAPQDATQVEEFVPSEKQSVRGRERWSTAFLIVGSALFGATALALWNRRTIAILRSQIESRGGTPALAEKNRDQEIF